MDTLITIDLEQDFLEYLEAHICIIQVTGFTQIQYFKNSTNQVRKQCDQRPLGC